MMSKKSKLDDKQPTIRKYLLKRSGSPLEDPSTSAKRIKLDVKDDDARTAKSPKRKVERYRKGGLVHTFHGVVYQLKLLMLFFKRALDMKYEFNLGTEVEDAEKFDDIVFKYKSEKHNIRFVQAKHKQNESKKITAHDLLAENESGNDFSLQKYFNSYRKIKENPMFNKYELQDFIIYTNINFNYSDLEKAEIRLQRVKEDDVILQVTKSEKTALRYKLSVGKEHELHQILIETSDLYLLAKKLMNHVLDNLPIKINSDDIWKHYHVPLSKTVFNVKREESPKKTKNCKIQKYAYFQKDFVEGTNLPEKVNNFRNILISIFGNSDDDVAFKKKLSESKLSVCSNFGEVFKLKSNPLLTNPAELAKMIVKYSNKAKEKVVLVKRNTRMIEDIVTLAGHVLVLDDEGLLIRFRKAFFDNNCKLDGNLEFFKKALKTELAKEDIDFSELRHYRYKIIDYNTCKETSKGELLPIYESELPSGTIESETIKEFFEKLTFAVNQPSEVELGDIIAEELGESVQFNLLNHDLLYNSFEKQMLDWFKEKGNVKGKEGRFLNHENGQEFFDSIEQKVNSLICIALSLPARDELRAYGIKFDKNDVLDELQTNFIYAANTSPKVLHLVTPKKTILSEIKVYSALESLKEQDAQYKKRDSYIFIKLKELLQTERQKVALGAFKAFGSHHLLIIVCDDKEEIKIRELYNKLNKILIETNKQIILIGEKDNTLVQKFPANQMRDFESTTKFDHLTGKSKKNLLKKKVIFQGRKGALQLGQLFSEIDGNELSSSEQINKLDIIDSDTLIQLISNNVIRIGSRLLGKGNLEGAYNKLYEFINKEVLFQILRESDNYTDFFVISGLDGENKKNFIENLLIDQNERCELTFKNDGLYTKVKDIKKIILVDSKFDNNNFKELCKNHPNKHFYWIKWEDNKFVLYNLYNPRFIKRQFKYPNKVTFCDDIKTELLNSSEDNVFFFTGVDKAEKLFEVLQLQDEIEKETLNENFTSGKIVLHTSNSRNESEFKNLTKKKIKENKSVYWLDVNNDDNEKQIIWRDVTRKTVSETDLIDTIEGQSAIIIDRPGMGKSTTLAILSGKMLKTHWVVFITFRDWQEIINNLPEEITNDAIIDFLSDTKNLNTPLEKSLAKFLLDKEHKGGIRPLLLVFDGFDEIRSYDTENAGKKKVEELLRFLKENTRATIWITAREQDATQLQNILSIFCVKFEPLEKDEHYVYFKDFWMNSLKLSVSKEESHSIFFGEDNKFQRYYDALSKAADAIVANKDNDFMGIPLTLRLFAEGFLHKFKEYVCSDECNENFAEDFDNLSILNLYKFFIDKKLKIYIWEKTNLSTGFTKTSEGWFREKLIKLHCRLAFKELFGGDETKELLGLKKPFEGEDSHVDSKQLAELLNVGIIRSIDEADHYEFLHRTVAEYLASRLLIYILKNKQHNNLAKYKRTLQFLHKNILKQSNEIIRNFLKAGMEQDKTLNDILQPIIIDIESNNLLGQAKNKYRFVIDAHKYRKAGDLNEIKEEIEKLRKAEDGPPQRGRHPKTTNFQSIIRDEFKPRFFHETDVKKLQYCLKYLIDMYSNAYDRPSRSLDNSINVLLRDNITDFIYHYILQAENQNKLDKDFIENCFKTICTKPIREISKFSNLNLENISESIKIVEKMIVSSCSPENKSEQDSKNKSKKHSKNNIIDIIFATRILTIKMAEAIISEFSKSSGATNLFFNSLISPLLTFKYYCSKYSFTFVNDIDSAALLDMFQGFASADKNRKPNMDLSQVSLEGLLLCIQQSLNPVKFSKDRFTISVKALIALKDWDFQMSYLNNALTLRHIHGYKSELNLKYEENIIELLIFRNNNPESCFDAKLTDIADNLSLATPASI